MYNYILTHMFCCFEKDLDDLEPSKFELTPYNDHKLVKLL